MDKFYLQHIASLKFERNTYGCAWGASLDRTGTGSTPHIKPRNTHSHATWPTWAAHTTTSPQHLSTVLNCRNLQSMSSSPSSGSMFMSTSPAYPAAAVSTAGSGRGRLCDDLPRCEATMAAASAAARSSLHRPSRSYAPFHMRSAAGWRSSRSRSRSLSSRGSKPTVR